MKEYKVVTWKMSLRNDNQRLEDVLNEHAKQGWYLVQVVDSSRSIVLVRDKNR
ncbi:MAG: hypothetical protein ACJAUQ_001447 [Maribacter sp.]|jgi:hypothetical protein